MNLQQLPLISIVTFLPLVGAVILLFVKKENTELIKRFALVWTIFTFVASLGFVIGFRTADPAPSLARRRYGDQKHSAARGP